MGTDHRAPRVSKEAAEAICSNPGKNSSLQSPGASPGVVTHIVSTWPSCSEALASLSSCWQSGIPTGLPSRT